jgi:hypothetical protein
MISAVPASGEKNVAATHAATVLFGKKIVSPQHVAQLP